MTSRVFACDTCKRLVTWPQDRMEKRLEFRRVTDQGWYKTRVIAHVCRQCADVEMALPTVTQLLRLRSFTQTGAARSIREVSGIHLGDVAAELGVEESTVSRWERGLRTPRRSPEALRYLELLEGLMAR